MVDSGHKDEFVCDTGLIILACSMADHLRFELNGACPNVMPRILRPCLDQLPR